GRPAPTALLAARLGAVREAPSPAYASAADPLWMGQPFEDTSVLERQDVKARRLGTGVQLTDPGQEFLGLGHLLDHEGEGLRGVLLLEDRVGDPPQLRELAIEAHDATGEVHHEDTVGRGLEVGGPAR